MTRIPAAVVNGKTATVIVLLVITSVLPSNAQRFRFTGTITEVISYPAGLPEDPVLADVCPGCVKGGTITIGMDVATCWFDSASPARETCEPGVWDQTNNQGTLSVAGRAWALNSGQIRLVPHPNGEAVSVGVNVWGLGEPRVSAGKVQATFSVLTPAQLLDPQGNVIEAVRARVDPDYKPYPGALVRGPFGTVVFSLCRTSDDETCRSPQGEIHFLVETVETGQGAESSQAPASLVIFVGGLGDAVFGHSMENLKDSYDRRLAQASPSLNQRTLYYERTDRDYIEDEIVSFRHRYPDGAVAVVGHSMGGHTAYAAVQALEPTQEAGSPPLVDLLVTLDPVTNPELVKHSPEYPSERKPPARPVPLTPMPRSLARWVNVHPSGPVGTSIDCPVPDWYTGRWERRTEAVNLVAGANHCSVPQMFDAACAEASAGERSRSTDCVLIPPFKKE
jgi:pimeloyl-ACP methyl ester carboxylesterase